MVSLKTKIFVIKKRNTDKISMKLNKKPMVLNVNWKCIYETMTYLILEKKNPASVH